LWATHGILPQVFWGVGKISSTQMLEFCRLNHPSRRCPVVPKCSAPIFWEGFLLILEMEDTSIWNGTSSFKTRVFFYPDLLHVQNLKNEGGDKTSRHFMFFSFLFWFSANKIPTDVWLPLRIGSGLPRQSREHARRGDSRGEIWWDFTGVSRKEVCQWEFFSSGARSKSPVTVEQFINSIFFIFILQGKTIYNFNIFHHAFRNESSVFSFFLEFSPKWSHLSEVAKNKFSTGKKIHGETSQACCPKPWSSGRSECQPCASPSKPRWVKAICQNRGVKEGNGNGKRERSRQKPEAA